MTIVGENDLPEHHESLWMLTISPGVWAVHFLASYLTAAIWCAKVADRSVPLGPARLAIVGYTVVAIVGIGATAWRGYRRVSFEPGQMPHDDATPLDRHRFLGFATLLLSALSIVATLFVAAVILFIKTCD